MHGSTGASTDSETRGADTFYFASLARGSFVMPRCADCGRWHFFPRVLCPHCGSDALAWQAPSGGATVYSTTTVRRPEGDYNVSLIDLDEGPRMMSRVAGVAPDAVRIGMRVRARIAQEAAGPLLEFVVAQVQP
ncbi:Zn-ribbon domain-containing OB-fold protein [Cupriavidus basilensis]|uniref:Zn-ribbon domain-containing OB-fold protein n=1 Tax=Cupriavidus basilensis TaxID=68895 RepID=UPI000751180C|nr:Zn-ribbon domain-containing OB-fold protein [Cupriavidus basilensis]